MFGHKVTLWLALWKRKRDVIGTEQEAHLKMFNRQCANFCTVSQKLPQQISEYFPRAADAIDIFGKIFLMRLFLSQLDLLDI
jgi:hypothetical protein